MDTLLPATVGYDAKHGDESQHDSLHQPLKFPLPQNVLFRVGVHGVIVLFKVHGAIVCEIHSDHKEWRLSSVS